MIENTIKVLCPARNNIHFESISDDVDQLLILQMSLLTTWIDLGQLRKRLKLYKMFSLICGGYP